MRHQNSVFHQLTKPLPWSVFDDAVAAHGADRGVRKLRTRDQFLALLYAQFSGAASLREIEAGLASQKVRLYHAGLRPVSRSTLADANARRSCAVYGAVFAEMVRRARPGVRRKLRGAVRLLDSTKVKLWGRGAAWARFSAHHSGAKLHVVYDPDDGMPRDAAVTADTVNDITPARALAIEPGATYVFDLGYYSFEWWAALQARGCRFVSRLKRNSTLKAATDRTVAPGSAILSDRIGRLPKRIGGGRKNPFVDQVREIKVSSERSGRLRLVTNDLTAPAEEIAGLYKERWEIELFFKWIKQNLKLRHFVGRGENAVKTQLYVALIAFLVLRLAHEAQKAVARAQAFARRDCPLFCVSDLGGSYILWRRTCDDDTETRASGRAAGRLRDAGRPSGR